MRSQAIPSVFAPPTTLEFVRHPVGLVQPARAAAREALDGTTGRPRAALPPGGCGAVALGEGRRDDRRTPPSRGSARPARDH